MLRAISSPAPVNAFIAANALVLAWDLIIAGRIVNNRRGGPVFLALTALAALLAVPAVVVAITAVTNLNGRAVYIIEWLWPFVLGVFALQALQALVRRKFSAFLAFPLAAYNVLLFMAALARFASTVMADPPAPLMAFAGAHAAVFAFLFGRGALASPLIVQIPILAPSFPAVYRIGKTMRVALTVWAAATSVLMMIEYPRAVQAGMTFRAFARERVQERPRGDFAIGIRLFPDLTGPPPSIAVREDLALVDSLDAAAVSVVIRPRGGTRALALDSLAHTLDPMRRRGALLIASLGYGTDDREQFRRDPEAYRRERLALLERVVQRVQPDIVFPALDPWEAGTAALGTVPARWWRTYLRESAAVAHAALPDIRVGVALSAYTAADSDLVIWAGQPDAGIDVIGLSLNPSYGGGASLQARFRAAQRWLASGQKPVWVLASGAYPRIFGERNQERALWGTMAWATSQRRVVGFVVVGAGDYDALTGMRTPSGRLRPAFSMLVAAKRRLAEARVIR